MPSGRSRSWLCFLFLGEGHDADAQKDDADAEEQGGIALNISGLQAAEEAAAFLCGQTTAVHRAIDDLLVDDAVHEVGDVPGSDTDAVDNAVDDVLVDPVGTLGDGALDT